MLKRFRQAWKIAKQIDEQKSITPMTVLPSWKSNQAIWKDWSTENAVREGYKASTWVYSCVNRIAKTAASVPWKVYRKTRKGLEEIRRISSCSQMHLFTDKMSWINPSCNCIPVATQFSRRFG